MIKYKKVRVPMPKRLVSGDLHDGHGHYCAVGWIARHTFGPPSCWPGDVYLRLGERTGAGREHDGSLRHIQ